MFYYLKLVIRYWWILLLIIAITTGSSAYLTLYYLPKEYKASTTLYILKKIATDSSNPAAERTIVYQDLMASEMLVKDFKEIVKSGIILQKVQDDLKSEFPVLGELSINKMAESVSVNVKTGTRLVVVNVTDSNPQAAAKVANTIASVFKAKSVELLGTDNVTIIDEASVPGEPEKPKPMRDIAMGGAGGFFGGIVLILFIEYIRKQKEIEDELNQASKAVQRIARMEERRKEEIPVS